jgi:uncharacterized metal-binding protein YceD (DUF177 family)
MPNHRSMNADTIYKIDFQGLATGKSHTYDFPIDDRFFARWPESEIGGGHGTVAVELVRHPSMMELTVWIEAEVTLTCDRCLDEFLCPVYFEGHPVVKISDEVPEGERYSGDAHVEANNSDGDILWISTAEDSIDLGQYVYESIMLSLPFQRVHPQMRDCNQDMLQRFRIVSEEEFETLAHNTGGGIDETIGGGQLAQALEGLKGKNNEEENTEEDDK